MKKNIVKSQRGTAALSWKTLIGICLVSAILSLFVQGCSSSEEDKEAIESVLEQDRLAGVETSSAVEYVIKQSRISLSDCPDDFKKAYIRHMNAWREMAAVEQEVEQWKQMYDSTGAYIESFLRGLVFDFSMTGESKVAAERILTHDSQARKEMRDSFAEVLSVAIDYGVDVDPYTH